MSSLVLHDNSHVLVLTGAGASADSGIATFRDANGLWENHRIEEVATPQAFERDPQLVWRFYSQRRRGVLQAQPNAGHLALAQLEHRLGDRFLLATQNVDGLHTRAGSTRVLEVHGNLLKTKCSACDREPFADQAGYDDELPLCSICAARGFRALLRPHIVWFGEMLDPMHWREIDGFIRDAEGDLVFLAIGTSGNVWPAAGLVNAAKRMGAQTWLINADAAANLHDFDHFIEGRSAEVLPRLFGI